MPVWVSTDATIDLNKDGVQRRHITSDCPTYLAEVPQVSRCQAKGKPNTDRLQERTARCEHAKCWPEWVAQQSAKKSRGRGKSGATATAAKATPPQKVGGKAADLAQKAKALRQKPQAAQAAAAA